MFLLFLSYMIAEIFVISKAWGAYGFVNLFFALFAGIVLGTGIIRNQGRYILVKVQAAAARGEALSDPLVHGVMVFFAGLLFIVPGFISDVIAILLLLPGSRHLFVAWFKKSVSKRMSAGAGNFRVFTFGNFGAAGGGFSTDFGQQSGPMRDVSPLGLEGDGRPRDSEGGEVIDVTPIKKEPRDND